jgi:hypothetical protein
MIAEAMRCSVEEVKRLPRRRFLQVRMFLEAEARAPGYHRVVMGEDTIN